MYIVYVKERPSQYQSSGYAILNHPVLKHKYFTSKKLSDEEKLNKLQCIIVSPTQELAYQTLIFTSELCENIGIRCSYAVGGTDREQNIKELTTFPKVFKLDEKT